MGGLDKEMDIWRDAPVLVLVLVLVATVGLFLCQEGCFDVISIFDGAFGSHTQGIVAGMLVSCGIVDFLVTVSTGYHMTSYSPIRVSVSDTT